MSADLVLIPVQPSPYDIWASQEIVNLIQEASIYKPKPKATFVINRRAPNTAIDFDVESTLAEFELPVIETTVGQRVIFAESAASGLSVLEQDARSLRTHPDRAQPGWRVRNDPPKKSLSTQESL